MTFALLYGALFGAFGPEAPFFPSFLASRSLDASQIGIVLAVGTLARIILGPLLGMVADRFGVRATLAVAALGAGLIGLGYLVAVTFAATAFVFATLASGLIVGAFGLPSIVVVSSSLFIAMVVALPRVPPLTRRVAELGDGGPFAGLAGLFATPMFRRMLLVAGMVIGSQAMSDAFAVIQWRSAGVSAFTISLLWSEAVLSEVGVFLLLGPRLLRLIGPGRCATIAACAGIVQWGTLASTTAPALLAFSQPLHGLTFALMHLSAQWLIAKSVPADRLATAQTIYGTLTLGLASVVLTFVSGEVHPKAGAHAFWLMSALCAAAVPFALSFRSVDHGQTPRVLTNLEAWIRRRLRSYLWRQWLNGHNRFKELRHRGVSRSKRRPQPVHRRASGTCQDTPPSRTPCATTSSMNSVPPPPLCSRKSITRSNRRGTDPYARWCGRGGVARHPPAGTATSRSS